MVRKKIRIEFLLLFSVFVISTCGLVYELIAGALASYLLGDSVKQFSFIIGVYLSSMGIGSYFSKYISKNHLDKFIDLEIAIGVIGGLSSVLLFLLFEYVDYFQQVLYFIVFITGCLVGIEIPLLINLLKDKFKFQDLISNVFTFDYIGALIASILFPLVLIPQLGIIRTSIFFGLLNIGIAGLFIWMFPNRLHSVKLLKIKVIICGIVLIGVFFFSETLLSTSEANLYGEKIIYSKTTLYQRVVITHSKNDIRLYLNNNLQFSSNDEYRYHEALVHPIMSLAPKAENILVLGGGDGLAVREILKYKSVKSITLVDLDPAVTKLFSNNPILAKLNNNSLNSNKLTIINKDALVWIKYNKKLFDLAIIDFPDPSNYSVGKLYTDYFYTKLKGALTSQGMAIIQSTSPYFAPKSFECINRTANVVFPNVQPYYCYVPSFGEWGFVLCSNHNLSFKQPLARRIDSLRFYDFDLKNLCNFPKDIKADNIDINQLNNQVLIRYFDEEWGKL